MTSFNLKDVQDNLLVYKHVGGEIGADPVHDVINLTLSDMSDDWIQGGNRYSGILLDIEVQPIDSETPVVTGSLNVTVEEAGRMLISKDVLSVSDVDTKVKDVECKVTTVPVFGFVETIGTKEGSEKSEKGNAVSSFSLSDLRNDKIFYVQSKHKGIEPVQDKFRVRCTDGSNVSPEVTIRVRIEPSNDEKPQILVQPNIVCVEDDYIAFSTAQINPFDQDRPADELLITIKKKPDHGQLLLQELTKLKPAVSFLRDALESIEETTLIYQHDGSETKLDAFEISVSDGKHVTK